MAIHNNREVSVLGPNNMANSPETINVQHKNGSHENVAVSQVYFTEEEKANLVKKHPSKYDDVKVTSKDDLEAVRTGVAPSYDPSYKIQAEHAAHAKKQAEQAQSKSVTAPVTPTSVPYNPETKTTPWTQN